MKPSSSAFNWAIDSDLTCRDRKGSRTELDSHRMSTGPRWRSFWLGFAILSLVFSPWLVAWAHFAWTDELASYVLLIPFISGYLIWQRRTESVAAVGSSSSRQLVI